jgi:hypothetical protein
VGLLRSTMADTNKDTKRKPPGTALHLDPKRVEAARLKAQVLEVAEEVFDRYVWGESFQEIADSMPFAIAGWKLRQILMDSDETSEQYAMAGIERAHNLVDAALQYGRRAAAIGDASGLKAAIDVNLKVAAKLNAAAYGDKTKVEHTGANGRAIEIKADLSLTAEQAYERLIKGE